jgi:hypothetical protein
MPSRVRGRRTGVLPATLPLIRLAADAARHLLSRGERVATSRARREGRAAKVLRFPSPTQRWGGSDAKGVRGGGRSFAVEFLGESSSQASPKKPPNRPRSEMRDLPAPEPKPGLRCAPSGLRLLRFAAYGSTTLR